MRVLEAVSIINFKIQLVAVNGEITIWPAVEDAVIATLLGISTFVAEASAQLGSMHPGRSWCSSALDGERWHPAALNSLRAHFDIQPTNKESGIYSGPIQVGQSVGRESLLKAVDGRLSVD